MKSSFERGGVPRFVWVLVGLLVTSLAFWGWIQSRRKGYQRLGLVLPRSSDDRLTEKIMAVSFAEVAARGPERSDEDSDTAWLCNHRALLERLSREGWWANERPGFVHIAEIGDHSRFYNERDLEGLILTKHRHLAHLKKLIYLRGAEARDLMVCGAEAEAVLAFHDAVSLAGLWFQNPDLLQLMSGTANWSSLAVMLDDHLPAAYAAEFAARLPDQRMLRWATMQAICHELEKTFDMLEDTGSMGLRESLLLDHERTFYLHHKKVAEVMDYLAGPWGNPSPLTQPVGDWADWIHNTAGKAVLDLQYPRLVPFICKQAVTQALMDSLRVRLLARADGVASDQASIEAWVARLDLRDPIDGRLYRVDSSGRLRLTYSLTQCVERDVRRFFGVR